MVIALALVCNLANAQAPTLTVTARDGTSKTYTRELPARPARPCATSAVTDPVYGRTMTYRAVPTAEVLKDTKVGADDYVQARATDNFSIGIPGRLLAGRTPRRSRPSSPSRIPRHPGPTIPHKSTRRAPVPFYIVWQLTPPATVSSEYWSYRLAALAVTDSPIKRWPGLGVGAEVPASDPIRAGLDRFVTLCFACHRFNGQGEGDQGPDLGQPMNPVDYLQPAALKKMIRNPASVRKWPDQKMPGFGEDTLSNSDLDAIIAWLTYKARQQR